MNETVGFIGLGTMGLPMASNLAKAGVRLIVHDTSAGARDAAAQFGGVTVAAGAAEVAARRFREDFYYRLCADRIVTPALSEQLRDCPADLAVMVPAEL